MRITEIRETAVRLESKLRNAAFSFDEMTTSIVAVVTDVVRAGKPVVGYAFNSTGRYACGAQMRDRLIPLSTLLSRTCADRRSHVHRLARRRAQAAQPRRAAW